MQVTLVVNMRCASCKRVVEDALKELNGVNSYSVNLVNNTVVVDYSSNEVDEKTIIKTIKENGFKVEKYLDEEETKNKEKKTRKIKIIKLVIGFILLIPVVFLGMGSMYSSIFPEWYKHYFFISGYIQLFLTLIILGLFFDFYIEGCKALFKGHPDMNTLVFLSSFASIAYSLYMTIYHTYEFITMDHSGMDMVSHIHYFYDGACMVLVVVSFGRLIESLSKKKAQDTINKLLELRPKTATVIRDGELFNVETKFLQAGDEVIIKPGENIPVDGFIKKGRSYVDESMLTGESTLIIKEEDSEVFAGTINKDGTINVIVTKTDKDSLLRHIVELVNKASDMKSNLTKMVDKVASIFVPIICGITIIVFIIWITLDYTLRGGNALLSHYNNGVQEAFGFAISVLTISCPCALGLATPISLLVGSSVFSNNGVLINDSSAIEKINKCDAIILDKTNTITEGKLTVEKYIDFKKDAGFNRVIYTIEKLSNHPFSEGIVNYFNYDKIDESVSDIKVIPGKGVEGTYNNETIYIGSFKMIKEILPAEEINKINEDELKGFLTAFAFTDKEIISIFLLKDHVKKEAYDFIKLCQKQFKIVSICTGDNESNALMVAKELGIDSVIANATPMVKEEYIKSLKDKGYKTIMVGDGINDSIALTLSDVSIGLAKGSDVALASSDFILMRDDLSAIFFILDFSKKIKNNIKFNLFWAFIYNIIMIPIAAGCFAAFNVYFDPMYCSLLMIISSISVCLNSLLLFRFMNKYKNNK